MTGRRRWQDVAPKDAVDLNLATNLSYTAPLTMDGQRCPWPWDPQQLRWAPLGMYHCPYCGEMVVAGVEHTDYAGFDDDYAQWCRRDKLRRRQLSRSYGAPGAGESPWLASPSGPWRGVQWTRHKRRCHARTTQGRRLRVMRSAFIPHRSRPHLILGIRGHIAFVPMSARLERLIRKWRVRRFPDSCPR